MALPQTYPLQLYRGDSFGITFAVWEDAAATVPTDLAGAVARSQVRVRQGSEDVLAELTCTVTAPNLVTVGIEPAAWPPAEGVLLPAIDGVWDLELTYPSGAVQTIVAGPARIVADVTRP